MQTVLVQHVVKRTALLFALLLAACSNGFARDTTFHAPAGWVHAPGPNGSDNWLNPAPNAHEFIMARVFDVPKESANVTGRRTRIQICNGQEAFFAVDSFGGNQPAEYVYADWDGKRHMAVYVRNAGQAPNPQAEAALRTICKKNP